MNVASERRIAYLCPPTQLTHTPCGGFVPTRIANMSCFNTLDFQTVDDLKLNPKWPAF